MRNHHGTTRKTMASRHRRKTEPPAVETGAPRVIAHRVARTAHANTPLSAADGAQFRRMHVENVAGANQAWAAMITQLFLENQKQAIAFMQSLWLPWMRPALSIKPVSSELHKAAVKSVSKGMPAVHRRGGANTKRRGPTKRKQRDPRPG